MSKEPRNFAATLNSISVRRGVLVFILLTTACLLLLQVARISISYNNPVDFRYFWAAGHIWAEGGNPYAPDFSETAAAFYELDTLHRWNYSPHIYGLTTALSTLPFETAFLLWSAIFVFSIVAGSVFIAKAIPPLTGRMSWCIAAGISLYTVVALGGSATLAIGQFAGVAFLGMSAFAYAVIRGARWAMVLALFILTMKASLGLAFVAFALMDRRWWGAVALSASLAIAASVPVLLATPLSEIISGYLHGVAEYGTYNANRPPAMTGLRTLVDRWMGLEISGLVLALAAAAVGAGLGLWAALAEAGMRPTLLTAFFAVLLFLVPMHLYDMVLVSALAIGIARPVFAVVFAIACLLLFQVNRVSGLLGIKEPDASSFQGSLLASLILATLFVVALLTLMAPRDVTVAE